MDLSLLTYHFMLPLLDFFHNLFGNYGWAILAVTVLIKIVLYPLTQKQTESMKRMQELQPKTKMIQDKFNKQKERYKDRPAKLKEAQEEFQKEMMEFYQANKVNPMGGCLPMVVQFPILIALFWTFNGSPFKPVSINVPIEVIESTAKKEIGTSSKPQIFIDNSGNKGRFSLSPGSIKIPVGTTIDYKILKLEGNAKESPQEIKWETLDTPNYAELYMNMNDISKILSIEEAGETAKITANQTGKLFLHAIFPATHSDDNFLFIQGLGKTGLINPITKALNVDVLILIILFTLSIWVSGKVTSMTTPPPSDPSQAEMQKTMQKIMPIMVGGMMLYFPVPAGVLLYFVASGFIQAGQTWLVMQPKSKPPIKETLLDEKPKKVEV